MGANGANVHIGAETPPFEVATVELAMTPQASKQYLSVHNRSSRNLGVGQDDDETGEGKTDNNCHRGLCKEHSTRTSTTSEREYPTGCSLR
jgi:hypothetical protein